MASFETRMTNFELEVLVVSIVVDISYIQCYQLKRLNQHSIMTLFCKLQKSIFKHYYSFVVSFVY